jgi:hypothetical protein
MPALAMFACVANPAVPSPSASVSVIPGTSESSSGSHTAQPGPIGPASAAPVTFATLGPGAPLPSQETCAQAVQSAPETVPANAQYNATRGQRRLPDDFFDEGSHDRRAITEIAPRVTGDFTGTTAEILQWAACKWGIDESLVRAQASRESEWRQSMMGDWSRDSSHCAPGHGLGVDGTPGQCPESWGVLQVRYRYFPGAFPDAISSTAFNADTAYAVWRACYEGYEEWLKDFAAPGYEYKAGDAWGCIGRWYAGAWYTPPARAYIDCVKRTLEGRECS